MRIEWTRSARRDLRALRAYIAEHDPLAAEETALKVLDTVDRLMTFPASGRPGQKPYTRELVIPTTPISWCIGSRTTSSKYYGLSMARGSGRTRAGWV